MQVDFVRFSIPAGVNSRLTDGYSLIIHFSENNSRFPHSPHFSEETSENSSEEVSENCYYISEAGRGERSSSRSNRVKVYKASLVRAEDVKELHRKLKKVKGFTGVLSSDVRVNREAIMRRKVDVILDSEERELDYPSVKLAAEKDVIIEVSLSKFLRVRGFKRLKLLDETRLLLRLLMKFRTPFVLTTGAEMIYELRPAKQLCRFFQFLVENESENESRLRWDKVMELNRKTGERIYRRLLDPNYIMDGLEIEDVLEEM